MKKNGYALLTGVSLAIAPNFAQAKDWDCTISKISGYSAVTPRALSLSIDNATGSFLVSFKLAKQIGHHKIRGELKRRVKNDQLFAWKLEDISFDLKPQPKQAFLNTALFRGRLNLKSGVLKIVGDFAVIGNPGSDGFNMRGKGVCK